MNAEFCWPMPPVAALLRGTALASGLLIAMIATTALAQATNDTLPDAPAPTDKAAVDGSDIVVTGSRIGKSGFNAPTPTTMLSATDLAKTGATNVGQLMNEIPAFQALTTPASTTTSSQNAGGSFLNLRGLGNNRTLVLVNSRRFVPTTSSALVDSNVIPSSLIERLDVVTGGASAAYGSDAIAGVVNIILKKNLEGFTGDLQSGISSHGDNRTIKGSLGWGTALGAGAGHFMIAVEGEKNDGIHSQADRGWSSRNYGLITNPAYTATNGQFRQFIAPDYQFANATLGGLITSGTLKGTDFGPGGVPRAFTYGQFAGAFQSGGSGVNGNLYGVLTVPTERYSVYAVGDYALGGVTAFFEGSHSYSRGKTTNLIPPFNLGNITIRRDNAYLSPALRARLLPTEASFSFGRFSPDIGYVGAVDSNRTDRFVGGFEGEFGGSWKWNIYGEYGHTLYASDLPRNIITAKFNKSVDAILGTNGQPVCRVNANAVMTDDDPNCVPVNLFGAGSPSQAAINYFTGVTTLRSKLDERVASGSLQGDLFSIGGKTVSVAAGIEYRSEQVRATSDAISRDGGFLVGNPQPISGKYEVKEAFGEILVPLLHGLPLVQSLDINGAVRVTDYSTSGTVATWKAGATWAVNDDLRLRFTRSRDIRAPNLDELFTSSQLRVSTVVDRFTGSQLVVNRITQGNQNLRPEVAQTLTGGVVVTPSFIPGLRASVDYYDIKLKGAISVLAPQDVIDRCFAGNTSLCGFLARNAAGTLTSVTLTQVNIAQLATRGVDFELGYSLPLDSLGMASNGRFSLRGLATYVERLSTDDGVTSVNRAGDVGSQHNGVPHWRYNLSLTYDNGPLTLYVQDRYVGGGKFDTTYGPLDVNDNYIKGRSYINMSIQYTVVDDGTRKFQMFANVNNLFDRDPPIDPSTFLAPMQTNPVLYDVIGRMMQVGVRFSY